MKKCEIPRKTLMLWKLRVGIAAAVITAALVMLYHISLWFLIAPALLAAVVLLVLFWYMPRFFKSYEVRFSDGIIIVDRGVFIKSSHIMPFSRLVYAESFATPLAKSMGLSGVSLKAARGIIVIPEMLNADVELLLTSVSGRNADE